jgi:putative PEP-CTERM system histidine kinase
MTAASVLAFSGALLAGVFSTVAAVRARRSSALWPFAIGMAVLAGEGVLGGLIAGADGPGELARLQQWRLLVDSMVPASWMLFSQTYARGKGRDFLKRWRIAVAAAFILPPAILLCLRRHLIAQVLKDSATTHWIVRLDTAGILLYALLLVSSVAIVMNLERTYRAAVGTMRWRIKFMLLGVGSLFIARIYTSSEALLFRGVDLSVENLNSAAMVAAGLLIARSFRRAGHFDVDVYPSQSFLQGSITIVIAGIYLVVVGSFAKMTAYFGGDNAFEMKALIALVSLVSFAVVLQSDRARLHLNRFVSRHFHRPLYNYRAVWINFTDATTSRVEQTELCRALVKLIADLFQSLSVGIWLLDQEKGAMAMAASTFLPSASGNADGLSKAETDLLVGYLVVNQQPADFESSMEPWALALRMVHRSEFPNGGHRVLLPLMNQGEVIGAITIGDRVAGAEFTLQDFDMLNCIGRHASSSLRNVQMSQALLQAKELEAFQTMAAFFVHDLKNAASTLNLMLQNLPAHFDDPAFREDSLRGVTKTVAHINRLIERLSLIRHEQNITCVESDLNDVVSEALSAFESKAGTGLSKSLVPMPRVMLDREQMLKVVTNLVLNATESIAPAGRVRIETRAEPNWAILSVADNGCGMSPEFLSKGLFRPFTTTKKNGLGIGMFQSRLIVESHGGRIAVASEPGKGTTFQVFLPATILPK